MKHEQMFLASIILIGLPFVVADTETLATTIGAIVGGVLGIFLFVCLVKLVSSIKVVEKGTVLVVERFGKFHRRLDAGLYFLLPWIDRPRALMSRTTETIIRNAGDRGYCSIEQYSQVRIDLREAVMNFPVQMVITRDNVEISVHPVVLYRIVDPVRAVYEVYDLPLAVEKLIQTSLRSIIGDMGLDDTLASREEINRALQQKISSIFLNWGFKLIKVDILEIMPATASIQQAMHKQISAERIRRAAIIEADGLREQAKTEAEGACAAMIAKSKGEQQVSIITAKGYADAKLLKANAEAEAIRIVGQALKEFDTDASQYIIGLKYIQALGKIAKSANERELYLGLEHDVIGALNCLQH